MSPTNSGSESEGDKPTASRRINRGPAAGPANRAALLRAAREVYGELGLSAPFSAVARRAGVGQGSLYRHFPDRVALAVALGDENLTEIEALAERIQIDDGSRGQDGGDAVLVVLELVAEQAVHGAAMVSMIFDHRDNARVTRLITRFISVISRMVDRDQGRGTIGAHADFREVLLAMSMLSSAIARADAGQRPEVAQRALALIRRAFEPC